jgi:hypothetical protein
MFRGKFAAVSPYALGLGFGLIVAGLLFPRVLTVPHRLWMALAEALSFVMTRVILAIVFFFVVTPIGLVRRLLPGNARARRREIAVGGTYWTPYPARQRDVRHYEKMY